MAANTQQQLFEAFQAFLATQESAPAKAPAKAKRSTRSTPAKRGTKASVLNAQTAAKRGTKATRSTPAGVITCGQAWELLGADPTYTPSNPSAPARNAQLWALNAKGLLRIAS